MSWSETEAVNEPLAQAAALYDEYITIARVAEAATLADPWGDIHCDSQPGAPLTLVISERLW